MRFRYCEVAYHASSYSDIVLCLGQQRYEGLRTQDFFVCHHRDATRRIGTKVPRHCTNIKEYVCFRVDIIIIFLVVSAVSRPLISFSTFQTSPLFLSIALQLCLSLSTATALSVAPRFFVLHRAHHVSSYFLGSVRS